jgi:hypothetical protein
MFRSLCTVVALRIRLKTYQENVVADAVAEGLPAAVPVRA